MTDNKDQTLDYILGQRTSNTTQELNLTPISKTITSFASTIQKWVTLIERVEAKTHFSLRDLAQDVVD